MNKIIILFFSYIVMSNVTSFCMDNELLQVRKDIDEWYDLSIKQYKILNELYKNRLENISLINEHTFLLLARKDFAKIKGLVLRIQDVPHKNEKYGSVDHVLHRVFGTDGMSPVKLKSGNRVTLLCDIKNYFFETDTPDIGDVIAYESGYMGIMKEKD